MYKLEILKSDALSNHRLGQPFYFSKWLETALKYIKRGKEHKQL